MTNPEYELRRALRRVEPPPGFADRIIERAARPKPRQDTGRKWTRWPIARLAAAAALAIAVTGGMWYRGEQRRQAAGEEAKRQLLLSLRIAGDKLQHVRARVNSEPENVNPEPRLR